MPIYEYDCQRCGTFEVSQKMSDPALTEHPGCGATVERRISVTSFALKGGGWCADGYSSTSSGSSTKSDGPACGGGGCAGGACGMN
jgi:putative FmdB family regulatory protein